MPQEVRLVRAQLAQSLHDFASARADFDRLAAERPDDLAVQLGLAAVATVTGDYRAALASCDALTATAPELIIVACKAPVELVRGGAERAYRELSEQSRRSGDASPRLLAWVATLQGELAASMGDAAAAERHLRGSLALAADTYTKVALADLYLATDRPALVLELLADQDANPGEPAEPGEPGEPAEPGDEAATQSDGLLLRLAIAQKRLRLPAGAASASALRERLAATVARGDFTHRREQGLFELDVEGRPVEAVGLLLANWELQKEPIDALLLLRAAAAARSPKAAAPVLAWIEQHHVRDHAIDRALAELTAAGAPQ
ncbi:MAG: hypothetical protein IPI49_10715 [Myxococcales bacterium]|nr:hypothetical protein [Myxococcales bacterium]